LLKRLDTLYLSYNTSFGNWKKGEFEAIQSVIQDAFWLDFTFFICYNKGRICEEAYRFSKFHEFVKWEMIDRLRF